MYVWREYGDIADIFKVTTYPEYEEVDYDEDELKKLNDPYGLKRPEIVKLTSMSLATMYRLERTSLEFTL